MALSKRSWRWHIASEILTRIILIVVFFISENARPFHRVILEEEMWLYKYPRTISYVPDYLLWTIISGLPVVIIILYHLIYKNTTDTREALLCLILVLFLTGSVTNLIKLGVGRPRPDFFARCFPDGKFNKDMKCTGDKHVVMQGRKSFPSGHSSFTFSSMCFLSQFLAGKLHCFNQKGRGQAWRLCIAIAPLMFAAMVAVSRTADYHHHWQDVTVGSLIGILVSCVCYRQYYPALDWTDSHLSHAQLARILPSTEPISKSASASYLPLTVERSREYILKTV